MRDLRSTLPVSVVQGLQRDLVVTSGTNWPTSNWELAVDRGIAAWTIPAEFSGSDFTTPEILEGCLELARGSLCLAFILSQFQAAVSRIVGSENKAFRQDWLPRLAAGEAFATVGISHLTTSRQHDREPALIAIPMGDGYELIGEAPWMTGAPQADLLIVGAVAPEGQLLFGVPRSRTGVTIGATYQLLALSESATAPAKFEHVRVGPTDWLAGPAKQVLSPNGASGAGSLTTSALALGHAWAAIDQLTQESDRRQDLRSVVDSLSQEGQFLRRRLSHVASGNDDPDWTSESLRAAGTSLSLRSCQAYLAATKGAGFVQGHPAERLVREALFFLVWSCPQGVATRLMNELGRCEESGFSQ